MFKRKSLTSVETKYDKVCIQNILRVLEFTDDSSVNKMFGNIIHFYFTRLYYITNVELFVLCYGLLCFSKYFY